MSDEDLIRRGDALEAIGYAAWKHAGDDAYSAAMDAGARHQTKADREAIAALPAAPAVKVRETALREAASVAFNACLYGSDGGDPTEAERLVCEEAGNRILALLDKPAALEVQPAPAPVAPEVAREFSPPYELTHADGDWWTLKAHGFVVATYSLTAWGSADKIIEAAWQHAYGSREVAPDDFTLSREHVFAAMEDGKGAWVSCSGCNTTIDGYPAGDFSRALQCYVGGGCHECGGMGAIWDTTDYAAMAEEMAQEPAPVAPEVKALLSVAQQVHSWMKGDRGYETLFGKEMRAALAALEARHD